MGTAFWDEDFLDPGPTLEESCLHSLHDLPYLASDRELGVDALNDDDFCPTLDSVDKAMYSIDSVAQKSSVHELMRLSSLGPPAGQELPNGSSSQSFGGEEHHNIVTSTFLNCNSLQDEEIIMSNLDKDPLYEQVIHQIQQAKKEDKRGQHWKEKVSKGQLPKPSKGNQSWAATKKELKDTFVADQRQKDPRYVLPWEEKNRIGQPVYQRRGNTAKVLYMELKRMHASGTIIELRESLGEPNSFYGMMQFTVPPKKRAVFDKGRFPSVDCERRHTCSPSATETKTRKKIWETAGWREEVKGGGRLVYRYDDTLHNKQRDQQPSEAKRRRISYTQSGVSSSSESP